MTALDARSETAAPTTRNEFPTPRSVALGRGDAASADPAVVLPSMLRVATERAAWLGDQLAEQVRREGGVPGLVGDQLAATADGELFRVSEFARVLADLEHRERETAARLATTMARLGIEARNAPGMVTVHELVAVIQNFAGELGFDYDSEPVRRAAQRAVLATRFAASEQQRRTAGGAR